MKVGIVTLFGDNFGNKLQNYALQTLVESLDHRAETIIVKDGKKLHRPESKKEAFGKYLPSYIVRAASARFKNKYPYKNQRDGIAASKQFGKTGEPKRLREMRHEAFTCFTNEKLKLSESGYTPGQADFADEYDAYICGSDQVWNPTYPSTGSAYFLQFVPEHKRIAFAPSFGIGKLPEALNALYERWLNGIPYLSVREEKGAGIIMQLTGRDVPVLPDPTLCLSAEQWEQMEKKPEFEANEYALTYFLGNETNKYRSYIEAYAKKRNLKIIDLFDMRAPEYYSSDPAEFVWLIHHAKAMFTDSFHGTVFSIIFHTPFIVFDRIESGGKGMSSRIDTLLRMAGLENRRFGEGTDIDSIGFDAADTAIAKQVEKAKAFLAGALEAAGGSSEAENGAPAFVQQHNKDCTGCAACANACPVNCISMQADEEGFMYPLIDEKKCIHCGKCLRLCAQAKQKAEPRGNEKAYAAYSKDEQVRSASSSGGMFSELAGAVIAKGGSVYGAAFAEDWSVEHRAVRDLRGLESLRGSKYVQSSMDNCFGEIKQKLDSGETVYFSGTPCQVDGLLAFLGKDYDNLITQDIICHGVPSPKVWLEYVKMHSSESPIKSISFRNKSFGWHYFSMRIETQKGEYTKRLDEDVYTRLFLENVILRPSCYACDHKHLYRKADITVADCWGKTMGLKDDDKGISLLFANTEKGQRLLNQIKDRLTFVEVPFDKASSSQGAMTRSVPYNQNRELFFLTAEENGMDKAIESWYGYDKLNLIKRKIGYRKFRLVRAIRKR